MKNYKKYDDVSDVTGTRQSDRMLHVGQKLGFMKKYVYELDHVADPDLVGFSKIYDRIFVSNDVRVDRAFFGNLTCISTGTITIFEDNPEERKFLIEMIETLWYPARAWELMSNEGPCVVTDAMGPQTYVEEKSGQVN